MYGFAIEVDLEFDAAIDRVIEALQAEGFGVLTDIDVQATLKSKLGVDKGPYRILGACNPPLASQAVDLEPDIGLLLPCNVVVRQSDEQKVRIAFMDPKAVLNLVDNPQVARLASDVRDRLDRVVTALGML
ncbi:protein of unknown function DUF302 [Thiorhodococcus drewsii AZ1]|uniref:DUF302 domain-containing protein n=1 Tax=Thiorhodococcus drewsii AZ1 TaxID=765913 RepID=G2E0U7_9GAMM|nr:DUF302 domain-containing protein [Thiorhodococcus drewsii]EGV31719.1 protein of unknown function DUF302 [Thiorhodococcus drewsii AZ1]